MPQKPFPGALLLVATLGASVACGSEGPSGPGERLEPGIHVVAGADLADTAWATPVQALSVRIVGPDRRARPGLEVRFESVLVSGRYGSTASVLVTDVASSTFGISSTDTTNAEGRATARVRLGEVAGPGAVVVSVAELALQDTARYTVRPGTATRLVIAPEDSAMYVGRGYTLRASLVDQLGNARSDPVTYTVASGPATVSGAAVSAPATGRSMVVARAQGLADTVYVSVVPQGTIAAYSVPGTRSFERAVYTLGLDGSELTQRVKSLTDPGNAGQMPSAWSPDARTLVYHDTRGDHTSQLYTLDLATGTTKRLIPSPDRVLAEAWPQRSRDGEWIYFNAQTDPYWSTLYRVRADGSGMAPVQTGRIAKTGYASPSPDGTRLAFVSNYDYEGGGLEVLELRTSQSTRLRVRAGTPRWSPSGDLIAYVALENSASYFDHRSILGTGELRVIRPDGTGMRTVTRTPAQFGLGIDWSPDGRYLVGASQGVLTLVDVATGELLPVHLGKSFAAPAWRP